MIALTLLLLAIGWLLVAAVTGFFAYRGTRKPWIQITITLIVLWLPFWDVIPGWILYQKAVREVGGVRIYKTVEAEGYLDRSATDCYSCWSRLKGSAYDFVEIERVTSRGALQELEMKRGFYAYRLAPVADAVCDSFQSLKNAAQLRQSYGLRNVCVAFGFSEKPSSTYEYSLGTTRYPDEGFFQPVVLSWNRFSTVESGEVLAEAYRVHFTSRIGRWIGWPVWNWTDDADGNPIRLVREKVIKPSS